LGLSPDDIIDTPVIKMSTHVWHHKVVRREILRFSQRNLWLLIANKRTRQICLIATTRSPAATDDPVERDEH
jgi:hypothetical protein